MGAVLRRSFITSDGINTARNFKPLSQPELAAILAKTAPVAQSGKFELYKTTTNFDNTLRQPQDFS